MKNKKYTKGLEDAERVFDLLDVRFKEKRRTDFLRQMQGGERKKGLDEVKKNNNRAIKEENDK